MTNLQEKMDQYSQTKISLTKLGVELGRQHQTINIEFVDLLGFTTSQWRIDGKLFEIRTFDGRSSIRSKSPVKEA